MAKTSKSPMAPPFPAQRTGQPMTMSPGMARKMEAMPMDKRMDQPKSKAKTAAEQRLEAQRKKTGGAKTPAERAMERKRGVRKGGD